MSWVCSAINCWSSVAGFWPVCEACQAETCWLKHRSVKLLSCCARAKPESRHPVAMLSPSEDLDLVCSSSGRDPNVAALERRQLCVLLVEVRFRIVAVAGSENWVVSSECCWRELQVFLDEHRRDGGANLLRRAGCRASPHVKSRQVAARVSPPSAESGVTSMDFCRRATNSSIDICFTSDWIQTVLPDDRFQPRLGSESAAACWPGAG